MPVRGVFFAPSNRANLFTVVAAARAETTLHSRFDRDDRRRSSDKPLSPRRLWIRMDRDDDRQGGRPRRRSDCKWAIQADSRPSLGQSLSCAVRGWHSLLRTTKTTTTQRSLLPEPPVSRPSRRSGFEEIRLQPAVAVCLPLHRQRIYSRFDQRSAPSLTRIGDERGNAPRMDTKQDGRLDARDRLHLMEFRRRSKADPHRPPSRYRSSNRKAGEDTTTCHTKICNRLPTDSAVICLDL